MRNLLYLLVAGFPLSELALARWRRASAHRARLEDRGSVQLLWLVIALSIAAAAACSSLSIGRMRLNETSLRLIAIGLLASGLSLRWIAILTLGRFFTVDVAIQKDHELVQVGVYRWMRHPSYSGLVLAFLGLGVFFGNWISLGVLLGPISVALGRRIAVEERALRTAMGASYAEYCRRTKRLLPGIF